MDREAWHAAVHGVTKSRTQLSHWTELNWVKAMVFPVVMYGCESWTIKKAELWRIDVFELLCWRRLLWTPWTSRWSNQLILNIHWKDWYWSWNSNTLATWCEELTHWKRVGHDWVTRLNWMGSFSEIILLLFVAFCFSHFNLCLRHKP